MRAGVRSLSLLARAGRAYPLLCLQSACKLNRICICLDRKFIACAATQAGLASKQELNKASPCKRIRSDHTDIPWPLVPMALFVPPASADSIAYAPGQGADVVKNIAGLAYAALLAFWLFKVIGRRVKRGTTERLASERDEDQEADNTPDDTEVSAGAAALGALQAGFFTYLLYLFSTSISTYFGRQELPDQYTAKNITVTIRTAVGGLAYLATFIFGANALGLTGLALKLALFPDTANNPGKDASEKQSKDDSLL